MTTKYLTSLALAAGLLLGSCASVQVSSEPLRPLHLEKGGGYAFVGEPADDLGKRIQAAIEDELRSRGLRPTSPEEAELLIAYRTSVEAETRINDPFFQFNAAEEIGVGTLEIDVLEGASKEPLWTGEGRGDLRKSAVLVGPFATELTPTDEVPDWKVRERVAAILARLGR